MPEERCDYSDTVVEIQNLDHASFKRKKQQQAMTSSQNVTFDMKMTELDLLKSQFTRHLRHLNALRFHYTDWFEKRHKSFAEMITLCHMKVPHIVPSSFDCIGRFQQCHDSLRSVSKTGLPAAKCVEAMGDYMQMWRRLAALNQHGRALHAKLCDYCTSVSMLREKKVKNTVDELQGRLNREAESCFDFRKIHNARDNLFTYKVALANQSFHGLLSLIPYLLKIATEICYLSSKIYLEKV